MVSGTGRSVVIVTSADAAPPRKKLRVGQTSERAGVNAVRTLLERHGLVVSEVDGRADYGRDLNVDLTKGREITAGIIGVQVKSGPSHFRRGRWVIPAAPVDWEYWRSSTVPIIGMVFDPTHDVVRWRNLSRLARSSVAADEDTFSPARQSDDTNEVVVATTLDDDSFAEFAADATAYLGAAAHDAFLVLLDPRDEVRCRGVGNCWTLARHDPRPLVLLRHLLPIMEGRSFLAALNVLAHATAHPDILWSTRNWISEPVAREVKRSFRWSGDEVVRMVNRFETMDEGGADWYRGGSGQNLWSILVADRQMVDLLPSAIAESVRAHFDRAAARLLIMFQYLTDDPGPDIEPLIRATPGLLDVEEAGWVVEAVREGGRFEVFA